MREIDVARVAVEADRDPALGLDAVELRQEVDVEVGAAELAVGDAAQAQVLLELDDVADRRVFDAPERGGVDLAVRELLPGSSEGGSSVSSGTGLGRQGPT